MFISVIGFLHDPIHLPQSFLLIIYTLIFFILSKNFDWLKNKIFIAPLLIPISFIISAIINNQSVVSLLIGNYQRNFGLLTTIGLILIFVLCANPNFSIKSFIDKGLIPVLILANIYGYLQFLNFDPIPWQKQNEGIQLTLGNPNFAGALFGMLFVLPLVKVIETKNFLLKTTYSLIFLSSVFLGIQTKSLQFIILAILSVGIFILLIFIKKFSIFSSRLKIKYLVMLALTLIVLPSIFFADKLMTIRDKLILEGNIYQRVDMMKNGLGIWQDNLFFGVGIDQFQMYAGPYRFSDQIAREGNMVIPDKSHNVLIDYLATGGLIAGLLWLIMTIVILIYLVKLIKNSSESIVYAAAMISIWLAYFVQSMLSPDQILLASIGYGSAGFIIGKNLTSKSAGLATHSKKFETKNYIKLFSIFLILITLLIYSRAFDANAGVKRMLQGEFTNSSQYLEVLDSFPNVKAAELVAVELVKDYKNCALAEEVANRMIKIDPRNSQGWFIKAVCANAVKNFTMAIKYVDNSLKFDPFNPFYLISKAKLETINGQFNDAKATLTKVKEINPLEVCGEDVLANTEPCANLREIISLEFSISKLEKSVQ
jgi:O-antigen ligase